jgi:hypothetical protein
MARLQTTRDVYARPVQMQRTVRRLSAPRERTLTELGLRDTRFDAAPAVPHHMITEAECARLTCATHGHEFDLDDCGA